MLVIIGAGDHGRMVADLLTACGRPPDGFVDTGPLRLIDGIPVWGDDALLPELGVRHMRCFVGLGSIRDTSGRRALFQRVVAAGLQLAPAAIHPSAIVAPSVSVGVGTVVLAGAVIQRATQIGVNVIVNTGAQIDHDCRIGDHAHIAPGAILLGRVSAEEGAHIGAGAMIRQGLTVGARAVVGMGAVVVRHVEEEETVVGNPARPCNLRTPM